MKFQFDPRQPYQTSAIEAVTDIFDGQPADVDQLLTSLQFFPPQQSLGLSDFGGQEALDIFEEIGAYGNNLILDEDTI